MRNRVTAEDKFPYLTKYYYGGGLFVSGASWTAAGNTTGLIFAGRPSRVAEPDLRADVSPYRVVVVAPSGLPVGRDGKRAGGVAAAADLGARPGLRPPGRHRVPVGVPGKDMYQLQGCAAVVSAQAAISGSARTARSQPR